MHSPAILILTSATLVLGGCFTGGDEWSVQKAFALVKAREACELKFSIKRWEAGEALGACYNLDSTKKVDFVLTRVTAGEGVREINLDDCTKGLQNEINGCSHGGASSVKDGAQIEWTYVSDPNGGQCNEDN